MLHNDVKNIVGVVKLVTGEDSREEVMGIYLRKLREFANGIHSDSTVEYVMIPVEEGVALCYVLTLGVQSTLRLVTNNLPTTDSSENMLLCTDNQTDQVLGFTQQNSQWVADSLENKLSIEAFTLAVYSAESENAINKLLNSRVIDILGETLQLENKAEALDILAGLNTI